MAVATDLTTSIGVGKCLRGRVGIVTGTKLHRDGRLIYTGFGLEDGKVWQTVNIQSVSWATTVQQLHRLVMRAKR